MAQRRSKGESSIHQDASGRWHGYVSLGLKDGGRRDRRHVSASTRADVVRKVRVLERRRDEGTVPTAGRITVAQWLDHWVTTIAPRRLRPKTLDGYQSAVRNRLKPALGHHRLDRLLPEHLEAFYRRCEQDELATATVLGYHRMLSRALKVAMQRGHVTRNVCQLVDPPSVRHQPVHPLTRLEARRVLAAARERPRNGARWTVALALGLRQGEALGLTWPQVNFDARTLTVDRALQRRTWRHGCVDPTRCGTSSSPDIRSARRCPQRHGGGLVFDSPKSLAGRRVIALPAQLLSLLREHRRTQEKEREFAGSEWQQRDLVFCQANGRPIDPTADYRDWKRLLQQAEVVGWEQRGRGTHAARHTAATLLLLQGVDVKVVATILGHSQTSLTRDTYQHVVPEIATDAARRMGEALWGPA